MNVEIVNFERDTSYHKSLTESRNRALQHVERNKIEYHRGANSRKILTLKIIFTYQ